MKSDISAHKKLYSVEFVRFIFSAIIVYYHIFHNNLDSAYYDGSRFLTMARDNCNFAGSIVECFFLISGYFMFRSFCSKKQSVLEFSYNKFARLWPVLAVHMLIGYKFFYFNKTHCLYNIFFLQAVGILPKVSGITWYVSPLFFSMIICFILYKLVKNKHIYNFLLALIVVASYTVIVINCPTMFTRNNVYGFVSVAMLRAFGGLGLGYLIAAAEERVRGLSCVKNFKETTFKKWSIFVLVSAVEIASLFYLLRYFFFADKSPNKQIYVVVAFSIFFICLISRRGIFTKLFGNKVCAFAGKYAYSIYIMQQIAFNILKKTLWQNSEYVYNHSLRTILISVAFSIVLGIATYYIVELPSFLLLKKLGKKLFKNNKAGK